MTVISNVGARLKSFVERIERLEEEKKALTGDIKEVYGEAKSTGFDTKILRQVIKIRATDKEKVAEEAALLDLYLAELGMTPLEEAIAEKKVEDEKKEAA